MDSKDKLVSVLAVSFAVMMISLAFAKRSCASELNLISYSISKHIKSDKDTTKYNERNPALGLELIGSKHGFTIGKYKDSYYTTAKYIGGLYLPYQTSHTKLGLMYGVVRSPSYLDNQVIPMVMPYFTAHWRTIGINVLYVPKFQKNGAHVIGVQFKMMLGD